MDQDSLFYSHIQGNVMRKSDFKVKLDTFMA